MLGYKQLRRGQTPTCKKCNCSKTISRDYETRY
jgi:hypothetical protein